MPTLILLRHGEADRNLESRPLTEIGHKEAEMLAKRLKTMKIDKIFASDLVRAQQTLKHYLDETKTSAEVITTSKLQEIYRTIIGGNPDTNTNEERTKKDSIRGEEIYQELKTEKGRIAIFAHGNLIRYFVAKTLEIDPILMWSKLVINTASITIIEHSTEGSRIIAINMIEHLCNPKRRIEDIINVPFKK